MLHYRAVPLMLLPALLFAQGDDRESVEALVKKLGSGNFQQRTAASEQLKQRPEAEPALREALKSLDPETKKRAAEILDYYDRRPVRELDDAVKNGQAGRAIGLIAAWPKGKYDAEVWSATSTLARTLVDLHQKNKGAKMQPVLDRCAQISPRIFVVERLTEQTKIAGEGPRFVRAREVDHDEYRDPPKIMNTLGVGSFLVAARSVRMDAKQTHVILAGESVYVNGGACIHHSLIVSGGSVTLDGYAEGCLVIARAKITIKDKIKGCRLIAGQSVNFDVPSEDCIITENESNPLGYIRWAEAKKDKDAPKAK